MQNRREIIKFFLKSTGILLKGANTKVISEKTKKYENSICMHNSLSNIIICIFLLLKYIIKNKINLIEILELFNNIQKIIVFCFKIEEEIGLNILICEGISYLFNLFNKKEEILEHYLNIIESNFVKLNLELKKPKINDFLNSFYLIAKIFKNVNYTYIKPLTGKYIDFIINYFNPDDIIAENQYVGQSLFSLCNSLIEQKEFDKVKQILEIFENKIIYINNSNKNFFGNKYIYESINEIKLLIILCKIYGNLSESKKILIKCILNKFINDHLYRKKSLIKYFLLFLNEILCQNLINDFSEYIFENDLLEFLFKPKNNFTNNLLSLSIVNYLLLNN